MEKQGYILLHRQLQDNTLWLLEPFTRGQAWVDLILLANHTESSFMIRGNLVVVKRGQIAWSEEALAKRYTWSRNKLRNFLKMLKTKQQIEQQKTAAINIITIVNYDKFQKTKQQTEQQKDNRLNNRKTYTINDNEYIKNEEEVGRGENKIFGNEKLFDGKLDKGLSPSFDKFLQKCAEKSIEPAIRAKAYLELQAEFSAKLVFWKEIRSCLEWLGDEHVSVVKPQTIRKWLNRSLQFQKDQEIKQKQEYQDKKIKENFKLAKTSLPPLWKPPT